LDRRTRQAGKAIALPGSGYPDHFFAQARHLLPEILEEPPHANAIWVRDSGDVLTERWVARTSVDCAAADECSPDEWLLVEAWDQS
jgi:hypothetical protein